MTVMCNACNDGKKVLSSVSDSKRCSASSYLDFDKREPVLPVDIKNLMHFHSYFSGKNVADQNSITTDLVPNTKISTSSFPAQQLLDPLNSASDCGKSSTEMNSYVRENGDEAVDIHLEQTKRFIKHDVARSRVFSEVFSAPISDITTGLDRTGEGMLSVETFRSRTFTPENSENDKDERLHYIDYSQEDNLSAEIRTGDDPVKVGISINSLSVLSLLKTDPLIWRPPEPANVEDDMDSITNNDDDDDDDDYRDGMKWGQSSSLGDFDKVHGSSYKEARQKAMMTAMNGQFKILVSRFLASEGLTSLTSALDGNDPGWLDIVTSLSWEAALFIKPDAKEGRAMDPGFYVKVKCAATGIPNQSQVIKGLIFKKNTAHKHMPVKCKNPRLLLVKGVLGQRELGLSSFNSMDQEKDYLKMVNEMIEACHPNLVLVEKSVSRDIQEFLLAKGMTLIFDMKIARLERISRCTGSQIIPSANILTNRNVTHCDLFHIEKLVEEHNNSSELGKKASKTLMFLEGFSKPLGCTILLKGAHIDELKRVKRVIQYTIFAAYHLILETSFFADQRALFSDLDSTEVDKATTDKSVPTTAFEDAPSLNSSSNIFASENVFLENSAHEGFYNAHLDASRQLGDLGYVCDADFSEDNFTQGSLPKNLINENAEANLSSLLSPTEFSMQLMSSFSTSLSKLLSDKQLKPYSSESVSYLFGFKEEEHEYPSLNVGPISSSTESMGDGIEATENIMAEKLNYNFFNIEKSEAFSTSNEQVQPSTAMTTNKFEVEGKDDSDGVLSPESILVLLSSQCIEKGLVCEQSHLSRIKYYGTFDVSLGRYLQDVLLNQKHACSSCGESPDAHIYCYTHQNGNLTVLVRQLSSSDTLLGEAEGKIWMWSRCLKCEDENGVPRSTKRVAMSAAARSLSFGKFLELSFTSHSAASRISSECGHSLHRDCLRFFGLGSKVAMFRYSPVEIYAACKPPSVLDFAVPNGQDWVVQEAKSVLQRGDIFYSEVANFLRNLKTSYLYSFSDLNKSISGFVKNICEAEDMLNHEKAEFEASLFKAVNHAGQHEKSASEILGLSWFNQELLLGLYVWDGRLHQLSQIGKAFDRSTDENERCIENGSIEYDDISSGAPNHFIAHNFLQRSACDAAYHSNPGLDEMECSIEAASFFDPSAAECVLNNTQRNALGEEFEAESAANVDIISDFEMVNEISIRKNGSFFPSTLKGHHSSIGVFRDSPLLNLEYPESLIWVSFSELRGTFKRDLDSGYLQKFSFVRSYTPKYLSPMHQLFPQERGLLHYPVGTKKVMSVCEDEISSIIACALALSEDQNCSPEAVDAFEGKMEADKELDNPSSSVISDGSVVSSNGSSDSLGMNFSRSFSLLYSDDASEGASSVDHLLTASENLHPEIPLGIGKEGLKRYSVVCIYAKQFYALRRMCCPSEQAYIISLSRCRKWDAQGGKSKAFFAKSMDDRFIIKQIKKAELDSFLKFAPDYFKHITHSLSTGSQTCLAKILGIYQVRVTRGGKEAKIDLMVMENLLFGRNVTRTYDLKGAILSRYVSGVNGGQEKVLLDQNFVEDMRLSPIYVGGRTKHLLQRAIWNDTSFLNAINVMDYSLLVGVDKKQQQIVFGIIDYLRQYTWDKQLETWVKASLVPKNSLPTIISPKEYKKRFRKFMARYFLTVPDSWCSAESAD